MNSSDVRQTVNAVMTIRSNYCVGDPYPISRYN